MEPQEDGSWSAHSVSGSAPFAMNPQMPSSPCPFFACEQARQAPTQSVMQQTPSMQKRPAEQLACTLQGDPTPAWGTHRLVVSQKNPVVQSAFVAQVAAHVAPSEHS